MEFNVAQLLREPVGSQREQHVSEGCPTDGGGSAPVGSTPIDGDVRLLRTDAGILVNAELKTVVEADCSRCLETARVPVTLTVEEEYYPTIDVASGALMPPPAEPTAFLIDEHHILDLCEAVRQQVIIAEPMQPLCRPDCAGLCAACGANLNSGPCTCPTLEGDARWAALREVTRTTKP